MPEFSTSILRYKLRFYYIHFMHFMHLQNLTISYLKSTWLYLIKFFTKHCKITELDFSLFSSKTWSLTYLRTKPVHGGRAFAHGHLSICTTVGHWSYPVNLYRSTAVPTRQLQRSTNSRGIHLLYQHLSIIAGRLLSFSPSIGTVWPRSRLCDDLRWTWKGAGHDNIRDGHDAARPVQII